MDIVQLTRSFFSCNFMLKFNFFYKCLAYVFTSKIGMFLVIPESCGMWVAGSLHLLLFCVLFSYFSKQFKIYKYFSNEKECK